jgi:glyoxylase-like metal-dependent hydrolase (beta-lactamase superfamily II)
MQRALAWLGTTLLAFGLFSCASEPTKEQSLVSRGVEALGGANALSGVRTVSVKGTMKQWEPEQSDAPDGEMRFCNAATFESVSDRGARATRTDWVRNFAYPAPRTFTFSEIVTPEAGYVLGVDSNGRNAQSLKTDPPAHSMSGVRLATAQRELKRLSPGALLLEMQANPQAMRPALDVVAEGRTYRAASYGGFTVAFDAQSGLPAIIRTLDYDNIWGDVTYDLRLSDWREVDGVKVAMTQKHELNGRAVIETRLSEVRINAPVDAARFEAPESIRAGAAKPATGNVPWQWVIRRQFLGLYLDSDNTSYDLRGSPGLRLQELAPGVSQVQGGTHNSLVVEMSDHLVVVDAPISDAQSAWLLKATQEKYPGKPIRWLVLTHHHMDHAGGLRGLLLDGKATLVVGQGAAAHFRRVLAAPISRNPDLPAHDFGRVPIVEVPESHVMADDRGRQVIAYRIDNPHAKGMLMAWVPEAKLGFVADIWSPGVPLPPKPNAGLVAVVNAVKKAGIQPERFAGGHGSSAPYRELTQLVGP